LIAKEPIFVIIQPQQMLHSAITQLRHNYPLGNHCVQLQALITSLITRYDYSAVISDGLLTMRDALLEEPFQGSRAKHFLLLIA